MTLRCPCGKESQLFVCVECAAAYRNQLATLPSLMHELDTVAARRTRYTRSGSASELFPLPINITAAQHKQSIRTHLVTSIRMLAEPTNAELPADTIPAMLAWLTRNADAIPLRPEGPDIAAEMNNLHLYGWIIVDQPPDTRYAGLCPQCGDAIHADPAATHTRCRCGHHINVNEVIAERMATARGYSLTVAEISTLGGIPRHKLRAWIERRELMTSGSSNEGRRLYPFGEAMELWELHQERVTAAKAAAERENDKRRARAARYATRRQAS